MIPARTKAPATRPESSRHGAGGKSAEWWPRWCRALAKWQRGVMLAVAVPIAPGAVTVDLQQAKNELAVIGVKLRSLTEDKLKPVALSGLRPAAQRFSSAETIFLLGDYKRASLLLYQLVGEPAADRQPYYAKAVFCLGESFFQTGNLQSAQAQFSVLIARRDAEYLQRSVRRLIDIGERTGRWQAVDTTLDSLEKSGALLPDVAYALARSQLRRDQPGKAVTLLSTVPDSHRLAAKARFLRAVAAVDLKRLDDASAQFAAVLQMKGKYDDLAVVRELAAINRGRLHLEQGRYREAADDYQGVSRTSPHFEEALYEVTWTYVQQAAAADSDEKRRAGLKKAQNALEILLLGDEDNPVTAEARLLLGNVLLRLGAHDQAAAVFGEVGARYVPTRDALKRIEGSMASPTAYYDAIVAKPEGAEILPPLARRWVDVTAKLKTATRVAADIEESERSLEEMRVLADKLSAALSGDVGTRLFPDLQEAVLRRIELGNALAAATERVLTVERVVLQRWLTKEQTAALAAVLAERAKVEPEYRALPKNREQYQARMETVEKRLARLQRASYQLRYPLQSMREGLAAVRRWLLSNADTLPAADAERLRQRIDLQTMELDELAGEQSRLDQGFERERAMQLAGDPAAVHDQQVRERYAATLEKEREILTPAEPIAKAQADNQTKQALSEIERLQLVAGGYAVELASFTDRLERTVSEKLGDVQRQVTHEGAAAGGFRDAINARRREAREVIGSVAAAALADVRSQFSEIVLRGEVGLIDVSWQRKEQDLNAVTRLTEERRRDLADLDAGFQEMLEHD